MTEYLCMSEGEDSGRVRMERVELVMVEDR